MTFKPYCPQCGRVKPDDVTATNCIPCGNSGHGYRLVANEKDRQDRIAHWKMYYDKNGFTEAERKAIPSWKHLNNVPKAALVEDEHVNQ
jgi:hypothetical protein